MLLDVSEEYGPHTLLLHSGIPDCCYTPEGLPGYPTGTRMEVVQVDEGYRCPGPGDEHEALRVFLVQRRGEQKEFLVFECLSCASFLWAAPR